MDYKEKLRNKKLKHKLDYIKLELEETLMEFHDSLISFQEDFNEYLDDWDNPKKNLKRVDSDLEFDIPKEKVNKVFKKIATKTHPDKLLNQSDKKDWSRVTQIAEELDIDISDVEVDDSIFLEKTIKGMEEKIGELKQTFAWLWEHSNKKEKPQLKKHILNVMGVKEK